ncbi:MAG: hypothetical protein R2830_10805 [Saprospiraceae bacterium]
MRKLLTISIAFFLIKNMLLGQVPAWTVNPANYANSMNFTCQVFLDGTPENGTANVLGAFVGNEVRGLATPVQVGSSAYYFLTVFSNVVSGEMVEFKVLLGSNSTVHPAAETASFIKNGQMGGFPIGYALHISAADDFPISLSAFPSQTVLQGEAFATIDLDGFLQTQDNDPVAWTATGGANLTANIAAGNILSVSANDPAWTGTDSVLITATETGTTNQYTASRYAVFTVNEGYDAPVFSYLPKQFVQDDLPLPSGNMNDRIEFDGSCLQYDIRLNLPTGNDAPPTWEQPTTNSGSMTIVVEVQGNCHTTGSLGDQLAGYVGGQFAGVATPQMSSGRLQFFLTLANIASGAICLKYYDSERQFLHEKTTALSFIPSGTAGTTGAPVVMELAPIKVSAGPTGEWMTTVLDPNWEGFQSGWFYATDCNRPEKKDSVEAVFVVKLCPAQSVDLDSMVGFCLRAIDGVSNVLWYENSFQVGADSTLGVFEPGIYHYEGDNSSHCPVIVGCPVVVDHAVPMNLANEISTTDMEDCGQLFLAPTINDISPPVAICQTANVYLDENGEGFLPANMVDGGSYASCGIDSIWVSQEQFLCSHLGPNNVQLTVLDSMGRLDSCIAIVNVLDTVAPIASCQNLSVLLEADGSMTLDPLALENGSTDNCGIAAFWTYPKKLYCPQVGDNTVTLYARDASYNIGTCQATVTVEPFFTIQDIIVTDETPGQGNGSITVLATALGGQLAWSINGGDWWQLVGEFKQLVQGGYPVVLQAFGTYGCRLEVGEVLVH